MKQTSMGEGKGNQGLKDEESSVERINKLHFKELNSFLKNIYSPEND